MFHQETSCRKLRWLATSAAASWIYHGVQPEASGAEAFQANGWAHQELWSQPVLWDAGFISQSTLAPGLHLPGHNFLRTVLQAERLFLTSPCFLLSFYRCQSCRIVRRLSLYTPASFSFTLHRYLPVSCMSNPSQCLTLGGSELTQEVTTKSWKMKNRWGGACFFCVRILLWAAHV